VSGLGSGHTLNCVLWIVSRSWEQLRWWHLRKKLMLLRSQYR